jgi:hypothetical protein
MTLPYWESDQVSGIIAGIIEAAGLESEISDEPIIPLQWRAFQAGVVFLIIMILLGFIVWSKPVSGQDTKEEIAE